MNLTQLKKRGHPPKGPPPREKESRRGKLPHYKLTQIYSPLVVVKTRSFLINNHTSIIFKKGTALKKAI